MRLAVFHAEEPRIGDKLHPQVGVALLELAHRGHQKAREPVDRGHDQVARHLVAAPLDAARKLRELVIGAAADAQQVLACLGRRVTARVALKQLRAKPPLQRVDMANDGGMMHPQHIRRAADRPHPRHLVGGADLIPMIK